MYKNICNFIPFHKDTLSIHTINHVLETKPQIFKQLITNQVYKVHYVIEGEGLLHTKNKSYKLNTGDIFFTFPSVPYAIHSIDNFKYAYISFIGSRANEILNNLQINEENCLFHNCSEVEDFWLSGFKVSQDVSDLISESILLYVFSFLGTKFKKDNNVQHKKNNVALMIKKCIDDNFSNVDFSLEFISNELSYNKKYISTVFKREIGINIVEYLHLVRIQLACTIIEQQEFSNIHDVSYRCGFSDPQYFSKIFRKRIGLSPKQYATYILERNGQSPALEKTN